MGVPALFRWLSQKYPKIISPVFEERPQNIDGHQVPVDITKPNPNGEEFDNLYLDMNNIVHPCSHPEDKPAPATEEDMMLAIFQYTDRVVNMVRPRKLLMIAVDGVAPRAKMNQQRSRRFRSAKEAKEKDEDKHEFLKILRSQNGGILKEGTEELMQKKTWDSNAITPGTPFMNLLAACLRYWCSYKLNADPAWRKLKVMISDASVPGEGEHKMMEFIRSQRSSPNHDPNTRHVIYGLDADLIMLGLATHEPHFRVLREDVFFQESKGRTCRICGQSGHLSDECKGEVKQKDGEFDEKDKAVAEKPYIWLHVSVLREYLQAELYVPQQPFRFDLERALDDWVFMCFFVGNDFLPHLPSLDIRENGIDTLIAIWRDNLPVMGGYLTKDGHVDLERAQFILDGLAKQEDAIFQRRRQTEERKEANAKRRKIEEQTRNNGRDTRSRTSQQSLAHSPALQNGETASSVLPLFAPGKGQVAKEITKMTHEMAVNRGVIYKANLDNKSAAAVLKSRMLRSDTDTTDMQLSSSAALMDQTATDKAPSLGQTPASALGKRKAGLMDKDLGENSNAKHQDSHPTVKEGGGELAPDDIRLWEEGYADRYYQHKFGIDPKDVTFRNRVARDYVEGLAWVLLYYFQGCPSWTWYYPHHYAPFAADFVDLASIKIKFDKGLPFRPYEQLMGVLPAASNHAIPEVFRGLMSDKDSEIRDFYPEEFPIDLNGKKFAWQGVALLPWIDEKRLLDAMGKKYPLLSAEDAARNEVGKDILIMSDRHPLYEEVASNFYSKRQGSPKYKLNSNISEGLAGKVQKNEEYELYSPLVFPLRDGNMPSLDENRSLSVHYEMPRSTHTHKSMLLRGVKLAAPTLDPADVEATKGRAGRSGRSHGGLSSKANFGSYQSQSSISYAPDTRPNPFATHIPPGYSLPYPLGGYRSGHHGSYVPGSRSSQPCPPAYHQGTSEQNGGGSRNHNPQVQFNQNKRTYNSPYEYTPDVILPPGTGRHINR